MNPRWWKLVEFSPLAAAVLVTRVSRHERRQKLALLSLVHHVERVWHRYLEEDDEDVRVNSAFVQSSLNVCVF